MKAKERSWHTISSVYDTITFSLFHNVTARIDAGTCVDDLVSGSGMNYLPCGDFAKADNHECSQRTWRGVQCCSALDDSGRVSCWVRILDIEKNIQNTPNGDFNTWAEGVQLPKAANEGEFVVKAIKISADIRSNDEVRKSE